MTNKRFISILITIFLLFVAVFGSAGCGGGGSSNPTDNEANNPIPRPEPTPTPEPEPEPAPAPEPEPTPAPTVYFTVTFDSQGGSSVPSQRVKSGKTVTKPVDPTRDGHTFTGWYKSANGTTQFKFGSDGDKITRDITLYAKWSEVPKPETYYTVTFDSNGGSSVPSQRVIAGGTVTRPADPVKEGYTFNGWFLASKQFKFGNGGDKVTGDITLVAGWMIINYTVTFDSRGGSSVPNQSVSYGGTISKPSDPVRNGYTFVGWYKDSTLTEAFRFGSGGDKVTSNLTLYAKWSMSDSSRADIAVHKISIGYQDGDSSEHVTGNIILPYNVDVSGNLVNIVWTSNKPDVISTNGIVNRQSSNVTVRLTATVTVGNVKRSVIFDITVISIVPEPEPTPIPTPEPIPSGSHTITFDSKGGTFVATSTVQFGDVAQEPDEPTREGYTFAGWYDSDGYIFEFGLPISKDITLTADWAEIFEPSTIEEAQGMAEVYEALEEVEIGGIVSVSFDTDGTSPIMSLDVTYTLDDAGVIDVTEVESGPLTKTAGLVGNPVDISVVGDGQVTSAEIVFGLAPSRTNKDDFGIVWYDESNDIVVSLDSEVIGDTVRASVDHFSQYAVVELATFSEVWNSIIPKIRTGNETLDVIMLIDMYGYGSNAFNPLKIQTGYPKSVEMAKKFVEYMNDGDRITVVGCYSNEYNQYSSVPSSGVLISQNPLKIWNMTDSSLEGDIYKTQIGSSSRKQEIANWIDTMMPSTYRFNTSGHYLTAFDYAHKVFNDGGNERNQDYISVIVFISPNTMPVGYTFDNYIADPSSGIGAKLELIKQDGLSVIMIDTRTASSKQYEGFEKLADITAGSYIDAEKIKADEVKTTLRNSMEKVTEITDDEVLSQDLDHDGLNDFLETKGILDQYNSVWKTDPTTADSDGDGKLDGEEILPQTYTDIYGVEHRHYKRISNPNLYTYGRPDPLNTAYVTLSEAMLATHDIVKKQINIAVDVTDWLYLEEKTRETFYSPASNLNVQLTVPEHFTIVKSPTSSDVKTINEQYNSKRMTYKATLSYSEDKLPDVSYLTWRVTASNLDRIIEKQQLIDFNTLQINSGLLNTASNAIQNVANDFINAIIGGMEEKASTATTKLEEVKKVIKATGNQNVPDKIYEAFALAILEVLGESKIDGYESDMTKLVNQVYNQISSGLRNEEASLIIDGTTYHINYTVYAMAGVFTAWANVSYGNRSFYLTAANGMDASGAKALSEYCAILAQLNTDVWKDFLAYLVTDAVNAFSSSESIRLTNSGKKSKITYKSVRKNLDRAELIIKALCDTDYTDEMLKSFSTEAWKKLESEFFNPSSKKLVDFLEKMVPGLTKVLKSAGKIKSTIEKYRGYENKVSDYITISRKEGISKATEQTRTAFNEFKDLYQSLGDIDIFQGFITIPEWPKGDIWNTPRKQ